MGYKLSPKDFEKMMKSNPHIKVRDSFGETIDIENVDLTPKSKKKTKEAKDVVPTDIQATDVKTTKTKKEPKPKSALNKTYDNVYASLDNSVGEYEIVDNSLVIVFRGAKLFSRNQTDSLKEQKPRPFRLAKYKKLWLSKVQAVLENILVDLLNNEITLPEFKGNKLRLYLYRQIQTGQKMYDEDNLTTSFKYFIDGLRQEIDVAEKKWRLIEDDNQTIINECVPFQVKADDDMVAIRILIGSNKPIINSYEEFKKSR